VSGEISASEWDKQDGSKGFSLDLRVNELDLIGGRRDDQAQPSATTPQKPAQPGNDDFDDDIPF
jgi:single-stranded DNA-binding protein